MSSLHLDARGHRSLHTDKASRRAPAPAAARAWHWAGPCPRSALARAVRRKKSDPPVKGIDRPRHCHYTSRQCQSRSAPQAFLPNPSKGLVRASSAASAARCAPPLAAPSPSPVPCGAPPCRKPTATTPPRKIRKPPPPAGCLFRACRAPRPPLPLCGLGLRSRPRRPRSGRVRVQPRSRRTCSRICSPAVTTPREPAARHVATGMTSASPRRHSLSSVPKPVRFSTPRSRTAIPTP